MTLILALAIIMNLTPFVAWDYVNPAAPINWNWRPNLGLVSRWMNLPGGVWGGGQKWRDLVLKTGNDGTLTNMAFPPTSTSGWGSGGRPSSFGCIRFDGTDDYVNVGNVTSLAFERTSTFSLSCWLKDAGGGDHFLLAKELNGGNYTGYYLVTDSASTTIRLMLENANGNILEVRGSTNICDSVWHHLLATYDGTSVPGGINLYVDGKVETPTTVQNTLSATILSSASFTIGSRDGGGVPANCAIDDARVYNRVILPSEVPALYLDAKTGSPRSLNRIRRRWPVRTDIVPGTPSNSGFKTANADYNFARTVVTGAYPYLTVKVPILGTPGTTVTAVTDNYDVTPVAMEFIGRASSATGAGIMEFWGLNNPAVGTLNVRVQLSGAVTSAGLAEPYYCVHQVNPWTNFNSAQATNGASPADASVTITTGSVGSWAIGGIATTDATGITAGQTSRNNINAAASAGAAGDEDTGGPVAVGTTAMTYPAIDALAVWVMGGFELRSVTSDPLTGFPIVYDFGQEPILELWNIANLY